MAEKIYDDQIDHLTLYTGTTFGDGVRFLLVGAALGALAYHFYGGRAKRSTRATAPRAKHLAAEAASEAAEVLDEAGEGLENRLHDLAGRVRSVGERAGALVAGLSDAVRPTLDSAIAEGKRAAQETEHRLRADVELSGDKAALAGLPDDTAPADAPSTLPSSSTRKFIE